MHNMNITRPSALICTGHCGYCYKRIPVPRVLCHSLNIAQKFRVRVRKCYRTHASSGYCGRGVHNSTEVPGRYKNAVPVPRVLWPRAYRTYRSSGYGYECHAELTEVLCRVIPGQIPRIRFCMYPTYRTQIESFALVVGVHVAAVAFFAGNRCLVFAARGVRQAEALVLVVLLF